MFKPERKGKVSGYVNRYKEAVSLRDEIGICPNIEVEIDMAVKTPFFHWTISDKGGGQKNTG